MIILGIETSCDETSVSVLKIERGCFNILSNIVYSQVKVHAQYGGVVPEVAARLHIKIILPLVQQALKEARLSWKKIDSIAVCSGPGLMSSLLVGVETAKTLAYVFKKPLIKINHLEGHIFSGQNKAFEWKPPIIGFVVSGGHTHIYLIKDYLKYKLVGGTIDDAAGEAFDKVAKILGLGYPGGPAISNYVAKSKGSKLKKHQPIILPRPMIISNDLRMSFSGLKTAVLYAWRDCQLKFKGIELEKARLNLATDFQQAVMDVLVKKTLKAVEKYNAQTVVLGGGVSANFELRNQLGEAIAHNSKIKFIIPELKMTGDNAAMIAKAAYYHAKKKDFISPFKLTADANWELK
jgi:N6-L-threonylcarbamoyladenine synthase